jgi:hypothetical protein
MPGHIRYTRKRRSHEVSHPLALQALERRRKALELRVQGYTYKEIGREIGCGANRAGQMIRDLIAERAGELDDLVREQVELANVRLDAGVKALWPQYVQGDTDAVQAMMRIEERRAKLNGLDAPAKIQAEVDLRTMAPEEVAAIARRLGLSAVVIEGEAGTGEVAVGELAGVLEAALPEPKLPMNLLDHVDRMAEEILPDIPPEPSAQPASECLSTSEAITSGLESVDSGSSIDSNRTWPYSPSE